MRDIPVFTTENGIASLVLKEIPYRGEAYIILRDTQCPDVFLKECVEFCTAVGADKIYAKGNDLLGRYPLHTVIWKMQRQKNGIPETDASVFPVTEKTIDRWSSLYNEKMKNISNAATMTRMDCEKLIKRGKAYFVHRGGVVLGIGVAEGDTIETVIAEKRGYGKDVLLAMCSILFSDCIRLEVASDNIPAVRLYEKMGFVKNAEISRWYQVK